VDPSLLALALQAVGEGNQCGVPPISHSYHMAFPDSSLFVACAFFFLVSSLLLISNTNMYLPCFNLVYPVHYTILLQSVRKEKLGLNSSTVLGLLFHQAEILLPTFLLTLNLS